MGRRCALRLFPAPSLSAGRAMRPRRGRRARRCSPLRIPRGCCPPSGRFFSRWPEARLTFQGRSATSLAPFCRQPSSRLSRAGRQVRWPKPLRRLEGTERRKRRAALSSTACRLGSPARPSRLQPRHLARLSRAPRCSRAVRTSSPRYCRTHTFRCVSILRKRRPPRAIGSHRMQSRRSLRGSRGMRASVSCTCGRRSGRKMQNSRCA